MRYAKSGVLMLVTGLLSLPAMAGTVDSASVTTFQSGSTLSSQDMNATIDALVTAINDNATRIAEIENSVPTADVSGREYCIQELEVGFFIHNPLLDESQNAYPLGVEHGTFVASIAFVADGTGSATSLEENFVSGFPGFSAFQETPELGVESFTWTQTGNRLTMTFPGDGVDPDDVISVGVVNSGEILVAGGSISEPDEGGTGTWYFSNQIVAIEVDSAANCDGIFSY
ncbi:MAG: hypothetical protein HUJ31_03165 [Pseudomonadales bacterium]|nr:hypothetical protein [Pseudomonadales bacterium]